MQGRTAATRRGNFGFAVLSEGRAGRRGSSQAVLSATESVAAVSFRAGRGLAEETVPACPDHLEPPAVCGLVTVNVSRSIEDLYATRLTHRYVERPLRGLASLVRGS